MYDCEFTLTIKGESEEGDIKLTDVNNHDLDAEYEFEYKIKGSQLSSLIKKQKNNIESYIKELFIKFWKAQKN